uniref:F-box domain-containing protein n=1 Tax=Anopheles maculatus TaxID=74869 RepID=A0A182SKQ2_9DIPT
SSPARSVRSLSRPSVRASVSPKVHRTCGAQQNQSLKPSKRYSYCGFEYVNILQQLNKFDRDALGVVLEYLADTDLVQVVRVSRRWRSIIQNHKKCWARLQRYLKQQEERKENINGNRSSSGSNHYHHPEHGDTEGTPKGPCASNLNSELNGTYAEANGGQEAAVPVSTIDSIVSKRKPFKVCNYLDKSHVSSVGNASFGNVSGPELSLRRSSIVSGGGSSIVNVTQTPTVSPSMQKFITNQKVSFAYYLSPHNLNCRTAHDATLSNWL